MLFSRACRIHLPLRLLSTSIERDLRRLRLLVSMAGETSVDDLFTTTNDDNTKVYYHYHHTDACKALRWTARESFEFMYSRPWSVVNELYADLVNEKFSMRDLFGAQGFCYTDNEYAHDDDATAPEKSVDAGATKSGRLARKSFKIVLSYHGGSFDGWQKQPDLNTVQGLVEKSLGRFVDEKKAQLLIEKCKPLEGCAVVAGRTDRGVSALNQVCSFYTWRENVHTDDIRDAINGIMQQKIKAVSVSQVSRVFHPNFSAKWRRYLYIFPMNSGESADSSNTHRNFEEPHSMTKPSSFSVRKVNQLLRNLEKKLLSYKMFARDTKPSRNIGPPTECFIYHARAKEVRLPQLEGEAMCVELVANRFLRKMVRVIVATAVREAAAGAEEDALLRLMEASCRRATAPPSPPDGLCLVDVGYSEFDYKNCIFP